MGVQRTMKLRVVMMIVMFMIVRVEPTSNVFCSHEFAAAVVRACVRIRRARAPDTEASSSVFGT